MRISLQHLADAYTYYVKPFFAKPYWWMMHRLHPKHRYHKPICTLKPNYYDPDVRITNTIFEELVDFINKEDRIDRRATPEHRAAYLMLTSAYDYWVLERRELLELANIGWERDNERAHAGAFYIEEELIPMKDKIYMRNIIDNIRYLWYP